MPPIGEPDQVRQNQKAVRIALHFPHHNVSGLQRSADGQQVAALAPTTQYGGIAYHGEPLCACHRHLADYRIGQRVRQPKKCCIACFVIEAKNGYGDRGFNRLGSQWPPYQASDQRGSHKRRN
jgi:hypothetical protein